MMELLEDMGMIRWPMMVAALFLLVQIGRAAAVAGDPGPGAARTRHTILAWGLLNALLGILGTAIGLAMAGRAVAAAGEADPALVGAGVQVALTTTILGLILLVVAVAAWLILQVVQPRWPESAG